VTPVEAARQLHDFVAAREPSWRKLLQELIRTPSLFEREHEMVARVEAHIQSLGIPVQRVVHHSDHLRDEPAAQPPFSVGLDRHSLAARIPGSGGGRSLILSTHMDIVSEGEAAQWSHPPFSGHIDEAAGVIFGRGATDDKAGVVAALAVLEIIQRLPVRLKGDVICQFVLEDETTGNGTLLCLKKGLRADGAFIIDGTRLERAIGEHAGNLEFGIVVKGRPASVGVSHMGINAAEMMARLALHLRDVVLALNATRRAPWTQFPSPFQISLQHIESSGYHLMVPDVARARFYMTFLPPFTLARIRGFLMETAEKFSAMNQLGGPIEFEWDGFATEPVSADAPSLEAVLQESATSLGMTPITVGPSTGTSDLRHFAAVGIPCLLYGPGDGGNPHRLNEYYKLADLRRIVLLYVEVLRRWCGTSG
jgi:acetylornithine deacetylase